MSISTDVRVEGDHGCGLPQGEFWTFDADILLYSLLLDRDGLLHEVPARLEEVEGDRPPPHGGTLKERMRWPTHRRVSEPERAVPFHWDGTMVLEGPADADGHARGCWNLLFKGGRLQALRPGHDEAWKAEAALPEGGERPMDLEDGRSAVTRGLPEPPEGARWALHQGELHSLPVGKECEDTDEPHPFHGWVFVANGTDGWTAMRFAAGHVQWTVPVVEGVAHTPKVLAGLWPDAWRTGGGVDPLAAACAVLPTDYTDYGGDAVRWDRDDRVDADCSSGCRWWRPLHDRRRRSADGDWGACSSPTGPRRGLLTWEHQAGRGCFEGGEPDT